MDFYEQNTRTLIGFGVYFFNIGENRIDNIRYDLISDNSKTFSTDSISVIRAFRYLRTREFFKKIDTFNYVIWCDCGTHFRNSQILSYFFSELRSQNIKVSLNYFGEHHGKSFCDSHFSIISKYIEFATFKKQIVNSNDIVDAITSGQKKSNICR